MKTILISGFEPFHTHRRNSSLRIAEALDGVSLSPDVVLKSCILPVVYRESFETLLREIRRVQPIIVIALGQADRKKLSIERVALNIDDFSIVDNGGNLIVDREIVEGAPLAYWSTLPIKRIVRRLQLEDIEAEISNSAGTFVCNHLFYQLQHWLLHRNILSGFVHVPLLPEQSANRQSDMTTATMINAVRMVAEECYETLLVQLKTNEP